MRDKDDLILLQQYKKNKNYILKLLLLFFEIFIQDTKNFEYLLLINNKLFLTYCEIQQTIYKIVLNKIFD